MNTVIVIGCFVPGLAVIRALANKGLHIIAMTYSKNDIAHLSRYVSEVVQVPHPEKEPQRFLDCLLSNGERWQGALILETADHIAFVLSKHKSELSKYYRIVTPDWEVLQKFLEKEMTYALAEQCGVPYPKGYAVDSMTDLSSHPDIPFPCILKPIRSFDFVNRFQVKTFVVNDPEELSDKFQLCVDAGFPMLLQEIIPGPDDNLFKLHGYINSQGRMVSKFFYRKLRQSPPGFGVMRVGISTETNPQVARLSQQLLMHADYRGYFNTEFKKDPRDDTLKLMEVNCRMPRGGLLPTAAGVNYPWIIYLDLVRNQQIDVTDYKIGTYWIELYTDLSNSIFHHSEEDISLSEYIRPYLARHKAFAELDFHDLRPFMALTSQKLGGAWNRLVEH